MVTTKGSKSTKYYKHNISDLDYRLFQKKQIKRTLEID